MTSHVTPSDIAAAIAQVGALLPPDRAAMLNGCAAAGELRIAFEDLLENLYDFDVAADSDMLDQLRKVAASFRDHSEMFETIGLLRYPVPRPTLTPRQQQPDYRTAIKSR
jgi:hypothetical protein